MMNQTKEEILAKIAEVDDVADLEYHNEVQIIRPSEAFEAMQTFSDQNTKARDEVIKGCLEAFDEIAEAKGAYSMDRLEHASNTIRDMVGIARDKISELKKSIK